MFLVQILAKPLKHPFPTIQRGMHPIVRAVHRKERMSAIFVGVKFVGFAVFCGKSIHIQRLWRARRLPDGAVACSAKVFVA